MIFKGSQNDYSKYRAIGLLNHSYKIMIVIFLWRLVEECKDFFSGWQAGFRCKRGCRDNVMLLHLLYDQVITSSSACIVTYIDYSTTFNSVRHKFMDHTLVAKVGTAVKSGSIFRSIYVGVTGKATVRTVYGQHIFCNSYRGLFKEILSPLSCSYWDQLM